MISEDLRALQRISSNSLFHSFACSICSIASSSNDIFFFGQSVNVKSGNKGGRRFLCLCSLHVDNSDGKSTALSVGKGEPGAWKAHKMLLGERAMAEAVG